MVDLYCYTHFRPYLRDWFEAYKAEHPKASLTSVSRDVGLQSKSHLHRLMHNPKASLSLSLAEKFSQLLRHDRFEKEYFQCLILFSRERLPEEKSRLYQRMYRLLNRLRPKYLDEWQLDLFQEWFYPVVREVVDLQPAPVTIQDVAVRIFPAITIAQAKFAIEHLLRLGLLQPRKSGGWTATQQELDTPPDLRSISVHNFQKQMGKLALDALDSLPLEQREMVTTTFSIPNDSIPRIKELIQNFQSDLTREILSITTKPQITFQLNLQLFPLTVPNQEKSL